MNKHIIAWNTGQNEFLELTQLQTVNLRPYLSGFPIASSDSDLPKFLGDRHGWNQLEEAYMTDAFS